MSSHKAVAHLAPNWYAAIMGSGIVAVAAASLPTQRLGVPTPGPFTPGPFTPGPFTLGPFTSGQFTLWLQVFGLVVWVVAAGLLTALLAVTAWHWSRHPQRVRAHVLDPVMVCFFGAVPMALLTVGAGTLLLGEDVVGPQLAVGVDWALWGAGTLTGLAVALIVPYLVLGRHRIGVESAFGGWLMPVVPPMVSASTGALLVPHAPAGLPRICMLVACYAMFGLSLIASIVVIALICGRLVAHGVGPARTVPTLWIVLGPLGQSITAANLLGGAARSALPAPYSGALHRFGVVYGLPVWGFALIWATIAMTLTARTVVHSGLPFSLAWWSFTFPIGTCVTGTSALAAQTGAGLFRDAAVLGYAVLVTAWLVVAVRTALGCLRGDLFTETVHRIEKPAGPHLSAFDRLTRKIDYKRA